MPLPRKIAILPGDGIGKEVVAVGRDVLELYRTRRGLPIELWDLDLGADRYLRDGTTMPDDVFREIRDNCGAVLLGALGDPRVPDMAHGREILLGMRFRLDLFANIRPCKALDDRLVPLKNKTAKDVDFVVFRENTEGVYVNMGGNFKKGTPDEIAINEDINTRKGVERIIRAAFELARRRDGKKRVCMSDKANAMRFAHDLWQRTFREVAREYADIEASHLYVDVMAMEMVRNPGRFDVIVTNNLFGDIVTDLGAALQGGLGLAGSGNIHPGRVSLFEPVHGSAPDIAGQGIANPLATVLACGMMLTHLGHPHLEAAIQDAVRGNLADGQVTRELGGQLRTTEVTDALIARL